MWRQHSQVFLYKERCTQPQSSSCPCSYQILDLYPFLDSRFLHQRGIVLREMFCISTNWVLPEQGSKEPELDFYSALTLVRLSIHIAFYVRLSVSLFLRYHFWWRRHPQLVFTLTLSSVYNVIKGQVFTRYGMVWYGMVRSRWMWQWIEFWTVC